MIYSEAINKVCGLCVNATVLPDNENEVYCEICKKNMEITKKDCKKFKYDIFKKTVHKKRRFKKDFSPEEFAL